MFYPEKITDKTYSVLQFSQSSLRKVSELDAYCKWQGLDRDYFIERAIERIFEKDKDWQEEKANVG